MLELLLGILGAGVTASGWFFAWRSRGEASDMAERARLSEGKAASATTQVLQAQAEAAVAIAQHKGLELDIASTRQQLALARADKAALLEQLAKLGAPVGDDLFDSTVGRLYADRDRRSSGAGSSSGSGPPAVPAEPAAPPAGAGKGG